jgi:tetratricopeptide (TPR) repeat protein
MRRLLPALFAVGAVLFIGHECRGDVDPALKEKVLALNALTKDEDADKKLKELLRDKPGTKKLVAAANEIHQADPKKSPIKLNGAILLAIAATGVKEYGTAESFYEWSVATALRQQNEKRLVQAHLGLIRLYMIMKEYGKAETWCEKFMNDYESNSRAIQNAQFTVIELQITAISRQGETDKALEKVEALVSREGFGWFFMELKSSVQYDGGKLKDAIKTQKDFIEKIDEQERLPGDEKTRMKQQAQYRLTSFLVDNKQIDEAAKILKQLMQDDPENPSYYNDLGFIWADNDMNMEESEKLIRKALELDEKKRQKDLKAKKIDEVEAKQPNPAYLDSLGWVLYKNKKYAEAKKYLLEAAKDEDEGNHIEIWDHVADTQYALGEIKDAVETWQKALKLDDISKKDTERRKKVTEKLKKAKEELAKNK